MELPRDASNRPPAWLSRALLSGFVATVTMLVAMLVAYGAALLLASQAPASLDTESRRMMGHWFYGLTHNALVDATQANLYFAVGIHLAVGLIWAAFYAYFAEPRLTGPGWQRGLVFSILPWALSLLVFLPLVGGGFLGANMAAGPLPLLGNFILNAIYGVVLGQIYGPFGDILFTKDSAEEETSGLADDLRAIAGSDRIAARGVIFGLIGGLILGVLGALLLMPVPSADALLGSSPVAFVLGTMLIGAAFGALGGSLAGLPGPMVEATVATPDTPAGGERPSTTMPRSI